MVKIGESMISKESSITKEFIKRIFEATHKSSYIQHALRMIKNEKNMKAIIDYLGKEPNAEWQDIEYQILRII